MKPIVYGMISTAKSLRYTELAVNSFMENTVGDKKLHIIDNDGLSYSGKSTASVIRNKTPMSFAENLNTLMDIAIEDNSDLFFLSNDVYFPKNWNADLPTIEHILIPCCNQTHTYRDDVTNYETSPIMQLDGFDPLVADRVCVFHKKHYDKHTFYTGRQIPYYCVYFPLSVMQTVGKMDTGFGLAGAEDVDYRLRALQCGIKTLWAGFSWLVHFQGKSTWDGSETQMQTQNRDRQYITRFREKWGEDLTNLCLSQGDLQKLPNTPELMNHLMMNKWDSAMLDLIKK